MNDLGLRLLCIVVAQPFAAAMQAADLSALYLVRPCLVHLSQLLNGRPASSHFLQPSSEANHKGDGVQVS